LNAVDLKFSFTGLPAVVLQSLVGWGLFFRASALLVVLSEFGRLILLPERTYSSLSVGLRGSGCFG